MNNDKTIKWAAISFVLLMAGITLAYTKIDTVFIAIPFIASVPCLIMAIIADTENLNW